MRSVTQAIFAFRTSLHRREAKDTCVVFKNARAQNFIELYSQELEVA